MDRNAIIIIAGHRGLVSSALIRRLQAGGYGNLIMCGHAELDLTDQQEAQQFYAAEKPDYVFVAAAKVGGSDVNNTCPADFTYHI